MNNEKLLLHHCRVCSIGSRILDQTETDHLPFRTALNVDELMIPYLLVMKPRAAAVCRVFYCEVIITCCSLLITAYSIIPVVG